MNKLKQLLKRVYDYMCFTDRNLKALQEIYDGLHADALKERSSKRKPFKSTPYDQS